MDWNYILGDAEFYGIEFSELIAYVLLVAGIFVVIETLVDRIRGRKSGDRTTSMHAAAPSGRTARGH